MAKSKVAVIILNWNGIKDTIECLQSLKKLRQNSTKHSIYVVDNNSSDRSVSTIKKKFPSVNLIESNKNLGYAGGNNLGIKSALTQSPDYLLLLNNDTTIDPDCLDTLVKKSQQHNYHLSSPKIYFYPGKEFHHTSYLQKERGRVIWYAGGRIDWANVWAQHVGVDEVDHGQFDSTSPTDFASGCCMLIHRSVIDTIGFLDPGFTAYFEDNDYCQRAQKKGFRVGFVPTAIMWHKNAGSTGGSGSPAQKKLIDQSRLRFGLKHAPLRAKLALLKFHFQTKLNS